MNCRINFIHLLLCLTLIFTFACFDADKENSVTTELLKPVEVLIQGNVVDASTGDALEDISIKIKRINSDDSEEFLTDASSAELSEVTDQNGNFQFTTRIALDVNSYEHYLHISDPDDEYFVNDSNIIYSIKDATLNFTDVRMVSKNPITTTNITGKTVDVIDDSPVVSVALTLTHKTDTSITHSTITDALGDFAFSSVVVSEYTLDIDGSELSAPYVRETSDIILEGGDANGLGNIRIAQELANSDDLRIVLTWNQSAELDLDIQYTFPKEDFDFNHLGVQEIEVDGSDFSINPAYGFAEGLAYWPSSMGGNDSGRHTIYRSVEDEELAFTYTTAVDVSDTIQNTPIKPGSITIYYKDSTDAIFYIGADVDNGDGTGTFTGDNIDYTETRTVNYSSGVVTVSLNGSLYDAVADTVTFNYEYVDEDYLSSPISVGGNTIVERGRTSSDGGAPEVLTIYKRNFMSSYPQDLTYYYDYGLEDYYPSGIGVFSVYCPTAVTDDTKSIYDSSAEVKVYQGNTFLGKFSISDIAMGSLESNRKYWNVLLTEMGYTVASPDDTSDIYFRVVPYGSLAQQPEETDDMTFLYNAPGLPRDVTYTAYFDYKPFLQGSDMAKFIRMIGTDTGIIYPMSNSTIEGVGTNDYKWRTGFTSWSERFSALTGELAVKTIVGVSGASSYIFFAGFNPYPPSTDNFGMWYCTSSSENSASIVEGALAPEDWSAVNMGSTQDLNIFDSAIYIDSGGKKAVVATSSGPKYVDAMSGDTINTPGTWSSSLVSEIWHVCPLLNSEGNLDADNEIIASTVNSLWRLDRGDDTWYEVEFDPFGTPTSVSGVVAITPLFYGSAYGALFAYKEDNGNGDEYNICYYAYGEAIPSSGDNWDKTIKINDLKIFKFGISNFLFIATDQGVYYKRANEWGDKWSQSIITSPPQELSPMLSNVEVLKIVDYDGYIGLLTNGNGFIYAPYPEISGF